MDDIYDALVRSTVKDRGLLKGIAEKLEKEEGTFYSSVLSHEKGNMLLTTYYSLFTKLVKMVYEGVINTDVQTLLKFYMPIHMYKEKGEVPECVSELSGELLHLLVQYKKGEPDGESWGTYLFKKLHT